MSDYPTPELDGQQNLLGLAPRERPHGNQRHKVLVALEHAARPVTAHDLTRIVGSPANCVAKRLGELEADGHAYRTTQIAGPYGRDVWAWAAA